MERRDPCALKEDANAEKAQVDSRKRNSVGGMDDSVATKRMALNAEDGNASNNNNVSTPFNSVETAALEERMKKLERMYQRACRSARESEIRAERAEKIIASMQAEGAMNGSASKKEIDVKDEAKTTNNQPPIDNSAEITALQEQVKKLERMFQKACRAAREAELRAERAEQIIDSKYDIRASVDKNKETEQWKKKFTEISEELEKAKKREETRSREDKKVIDEMKKKEAEKPNGLQGGDMNNLGLRQRITELTRLLAESMRRERMTDNLNKEQAKQLKEMENNAKKKLKDKETPKDSEVPNFRPFNCFEEMRMQQKQHHRESNLEVFKEVERLLASVSEKTDDFLAILTPCKIPGKFVDFKTAAIFINRKYWNVWDKLTPLDERPYLTGDCCGKAITKSSFISHFCGKTHKKMMAKGGGGVSIAALNQWVEAMEGGKDKIPNGKEAPTAEPMENRELATFGRYDLRRSVRGGGGVSISALNQLVDDEEGDMDKDTNGKVDKASSRGRSRRKPRVQEGEQGDETAGATIEEAPSDESIQWIESVEKSGTADPAAVESFQMKRKREEALTRKHFQRIEAMEEDGAVSSEGEEGEGERDEQVDKASNSRRGRKIRGVRRSRAQGGDGEQGDETAKNAPVEDDEVLVIEAMEENETAEDSLGYDASVIVEESGVAEDTTAVGEEAIPIEAMEGSGTDAPVEDEAEPEAANGGGEGQEETEEGAVPHFQAPAANSGGFFSWLLGAFSQPVNDGEKIGLCTKKVSDK